MEEEKLNLYQKLAEIKKNVEVLQKTKTGHGYKYVPEDEILASVNLGMKRQGVSLVPKIVPNTTTVTPHHTVSTKVTPEGQPYEKHNNEIIVQADMEWEWINNENPSEKIIIPWVLVAQQSDASQAFGGALTYSSRFFLLKYFNTATVDSDPDNYRTKQQDVEDKEVATAVKVITEKIDKALKDYTGDDGAKKEKVGEFLKSVLKLNGKASANYMSIKDPVLAGEILQKVTEFIIKENK